MDDSRLCDCADYERRFERRDRTRAHDTALMERDDRSQMVVCPNCMAGIQVSARRGTGECPSCHCSFRVH